MESIDQAIVATLAYADIFQYPLTAAEIHHYLIGLECTPQEITHELQHSSTLLGRISSIGKYYTLPGREASLTARRQRAVTSSLLWPKAFRYGTWIAALPFIRMVAVTGSLAVDNANSSADLDFLIVTQAGRLWLARAFTILLVRLAASRGDTLCPNYLISEDNLVFTDRNLFTAHEIVQMVPLAGLSTYEKLRQMNAWTHLFLPNAEPRSGQDAPERMVFQAIKRSLEAMLRLPPGSWLEAWEMRRKVSQFNQLTMIHPEACFGPNLCKGHFDDHGYRIQQAFKDRMLAFEEVAL